MKSLVEGRDHHLASISQIVCFGDLSDEITARRQPVDTSSDRSISVAFTV
jgi:hypothetical protein